MHMTDLSVKNLKPPPAPQQIDYFDDPVKSGVRGLILHVSHGGTKTWRCMYYIAGGKSKTFKLGRYPVLKLAAARQAALAFLSDPNAAIEAKKPSKSDSSFSQVAEDYLSEHIDADKKRTAKVIRQQVNKHLLPQFKNYKFSDVRRAELAPLLARINQKHGPSMADTILGLFRSIANWYRDNRDEYYSSPYTKALRKIKRKRIRDRVLTDDEIKVFWTVTGEMGTFGSMLRVLLLTGQRRTKVASLKWADIRDGIWHIDTEEGEKPNPGKIKLPKMVLDIVKAQPRLEKNPYVFAATRGRGYFNAFSQFTETLRAEMLKALPDMKPHTIHDLRRTMRTRLSKIGIPLHVAERCIGHIVQGEREREYDQHDFEPEMTTAFEAVANHIYAIVIPPPENVVRISGHRR
jgi:integrase